MNQKGEATFPQGCPLFSLVCAAWLKPCPFP